MISSWILAARLRTLPAAIAPVLLGCALAYGEQKAHFLAAAAAMLGAILIQIGTNFANDYFDFINGADTEERIGPTRATQAGLITPTNMKWAFVLTFAATVPVIVYLTIRGGAPIVWIGLASIASGILYTGGPRPLGYMGLGDVFVLIFFGPIAVAGTHYVQSLQWSTDAMVIGIASGLISTAILVVNNLRDVSTDETVGKNTLVVRFGKQFARWEYSLCLLGAAAISAVYAFERPWIWSSVLALSLAIAPLRSIWKDEGRALDPNLAKTAKVLVAYSVTFSVGWILS